MTLPYPETLLPAERRHVDRAMTWAILRLQQDAHTDHDSVGAAEEDAEWLGHFLYCCAMIKRQRGDA